MSTAPFAAETRDTAGDKQMDARTVGAYPDSLKRLFVVEDVPAWSVELRSRARLRQMPKRHLADPSLAVAALDANPARLRKDLSSFGFCSSRWSCATCGSTQRPAAATWPITVTATGSR